MTEETDDTETIGDKQKISKKATISSDGNQLLVRIPKKIQEWMEIQKGEKLNFTAILDTENPENDELKVEYIQDED